MPCSTMDQLTAIKRPKLRKALVNWAQRKESDPDAAAVTDLTATVFVEELDKADDPGTTSLVNFLLDKLRCAV